MNRRRISASIISDVTSIAYGVSRWWRLFCARSTHPPIETYRPLVLNAFSHYNTERHEIRAELKKAIQSNKNLKAELGKL
jgi:hypothetical protein